MSEVTAIVQNIQSELTKLALLRLDPRTAHMLKDEEVALGQAMTSLQVLLSHLDVDYPRLRVVK